MASMARTELERYADGGYNESGRRYDQKTMEGQAT